MPKTESAKIENEKRKHERKGGTYFTESKVQFDYDVLMSYYELPYNEKLHKKIMKYFTTYYARNRKGGYFYFDVDNNKYEDFSKAQFEQLYKEDHLLIKGIEGKKILTVFNLLDEFSKTLPFREEFSIKKKAITFKTDGYVLNTFRGVNAEYIETEPTAAEEKKVQRIWNHFESVLCGGNEEQFKWVTKWIVLVMNLVKTQKLWGLSTGQGTGKTQVVTFFQAILNRPDSKPICTTINNEGVLTNASGFNSLLENQQLVILEEIEGQTPAQASALVGKLKPYITESTCSITKKGKDSEIKENNTNWMVISNNLKFDFASDDRRFFISDVDEKYAKNDDESKRYFTKLAEAMTNPRIQSIFYSQCKNMYNNDKKHFEEIIHERPPITSTKQALTKLGNHLHFVKYFLKIEKQDTQKSLTEMYFIYNNWYNDVAKDKRDYPADDRLIKKNAFVPHFNNVDCLRASKKGNNAYMFNWNYNDIVKYFIERQWINKYEVSEYEVDELIPADKKVDKEADEKEFEKEVEKRVNEEVEKRFKIEFEKKFEEEVVKKFKKLLKRKTSNLEHENEQLIDDNTKLKKEISQLKQGMHPLSPAKQEVKTQGMHPLSPAKQEVKPQEVKTPEKKEASKFWGRTVAEEVEVVEVDEFYVS
jgi:hypothetical protein